MYSPPDLDENDPNQYVTSFQYNADKEPTLITRPDGKTIGFDYDSGGRLEFLTIPFGAGSGDYEYRYYPTSGNLEKIIAPDGGTLTFTYDGKLPLTTTWAGDVAGSISQVLDDNLRVTSRSVNGGNTIAFGYDDDDVIDMAGSETLNYYPSSGLLKDTTLDNVIDDRTYNGFGELDTYTASTDISNVVTEVFKEEFILRDKLGRIKQKKETVNGASHTYDYTYDLAGHLNKGVKSLLDYKLKKHTPPENYSPLFLFYH
ncbi:MAG: RHS repeat protein [Candidatus Nitronauta litoralis]|uniref:RHS repeat protein n=1 Tax=Candidatus Nitronauta litoralis TaxID=2705533 RepID=A0A7T0G0Z0_9BACT|nr:MAG: RHS repeat protein [Candidatus Nitronauta litoralis]